MRTMNDVIMKCGLKYSGRYDWEYCEVNGTSWKVEIPIRRIREFTRLFPEIDWYNGSFLEEIVGEYVRVTFDDNMNLYSLHHIIKKIDYIIRN